MTDPVDMQAPDASGTGAISAFDFQASVALYFVLQMIGGSDVLHVTCEHFEDVVVAWTPAADSDPGRPSWEFLQVKSRTAEEVWTLRKIAKSGALKSLLRSDRALRRQTPRGAAIDYRLTAAVEGSLRSAEVDDDGRFACFRRGTASDDVVWLAEELGADVPEVLDFLSRVHISPLPRRAELERKNMDALQSLTTHLTVGEVRGIHAELTGMVRLAMGGRLIPDWQRAITDASPTPVVLGKRLTPAKVARIRLRLQDDELFDFLEASSLADKTHPYFLAASARTPRLADVHIPLQVTSEDGSRAVLANAIGAGDSMSVIVAGPGGGKTSLLRTLQADCARSWLAGDEQPFLSVVVPAASLVGRTLTAAIAHAANEFLSDLGLRRTLGDDFFSKPPGDRKRWLILVDGLDEIADTDRRQNVIGKLAQLAAQSRGPGYQFIIATRPIPEHELGLLGRVSLYRMQHLSHEALVTVVERWLGHLGLEDPAKAARELMLTLDDVDMGEVARVPLMAALLCQVYAADPGRSVPRGRSELYARFADLSAARMNGRGEAGIRRQTRETLSRFGSDAENWADAFLDKVYELIDQLAAEDTAAPKDPRSYLSAPGEYVDPTDLSIDHWIDRLAELPAAARPRAVPDEDWKSFLASVLRRCGLFTSRGRDLTFLHQTLQEFCAARYANRSLEELSAELIEILKPWNENTYSNPWSARLDLVSYIAFLVDSQGSKDKALVFDQLASIVNSENLKGSLLISLLVPLGALTGDRGRDLVRRATDSLIAAIDDPAEDDDGTTRVWAAEILAYLDAELGIAALARLSRDPSVDEIFNEEPSDPEFSDRYIAAVHLLSLDRRRGADAFLDLVHDDEDLDDGVRVEAARMLLRIHDDRAAAALESLVRDQNLLDEEQERAMALLRIADKRASTI